MEKCSGFWLLGLSYTNMTVRRKRGMHLCVSNGLSNPERSQYVDQGVWARRVAQKVGRWSGIFKCWQARSKANMHSEASLGGKKPWRIKYNWVQTKRQVSQSQREQAFSSRRQEWWGIYRNAAQTKRHCSQLLTCLTLLMDMEDYIFGSQVPSFLKPYGFVDQGTSRWLLAPFGQNICCPWQQRNWPIRARLHCRGWISIHRMMLLFFSGLPAGKHTTKHSSHSLSGLQELSSIQQLLLPTHLPSLLPLAFLPALEISEAIFLCSTHVALHFVGQQTILALIFSFFYSKTKAVFISHLSFRCTPPLFWVVLAL